MTSSDTHIQQKSTEYTWQAGINRCSDIHEKRYVA